MNKNLLKILVGIIALSLAACAAFFSIVGLSKLFAGAFVAVVFMASTLEASKLVIASFLYRTWSSVNKILRAYLIAAIAIIALITSIGIYGFLSGAYQNTKSQYELSTSQNDSLTIKKSYYDNNLTSYKTQLEIKTNQLTNLSNIRNSQEIRATQLVTLNKSSNSADRSASKTDKSIIQLNKDINILNDSIVKFSMLSSKLQLQSTQAKLQSEVSSELGSLTYIARVTGIEMDIVVNILIILFMIVFDPLAICMVLAFNYLNEDKEKQKQHIIDIMKSDEELGLYSDIELANIVSDIQSVAPLEPIETIPLDIVPQEEEDQSITEETRRVLEKQKKIQDRLESQRSGYGVKIY
jgi:hypothetical protein